MAGPGGGPPRRSHKKSRLGCQTCKNRHIRCDEGFPQCRNCTKHNCRCDYMDSPPPAEDVSRSPRGPDLLWTPNIEAEVHAWHSTGTYPFPELGLSTHQHFLGLNKTERRLVHHVSSIYRDLQRHDMLHCVAWAAKLPTFLDIAAGYDYVMSAILAFSATHLAWVTKSTETTNVAYHYRGIALKGLHERAIPTFSQENSDPILAASILLSWQASDWTGWNSLMEGTMTVLTSMDAWRYQSRLADYVQSHVLPPPRSFAPTPIGSYNAPPLPEDDRSLRDSIRMLELLLEYFPTKHPLRAYVDDILEAAREIDICSARMPAHLLFEKLQTFRARLLWMPVSFAQRVENSTLNLLVIAHLYAVGLAIDSSIPELNGAALGALTAGPIEEIDRRLRRSHSPSFHSSFESARLDRMMQFPRQIAARNRYRHSTRERASEALASGEHSPYGFQTLRIGSAPTTPGFPPSFPTFHDQSIEDLSVPPSPFLSHNYNASPSSQCPEQHFERTSRSGSMNINFDRRSFSVPFPTLDSPAYSPAYSPALTFPDDDYRFALGESSASGYHSGDSSHNDPYRKGTQRRYS